MTQLDVGIGLVIYSESFAGKHLRLHRRFRIL